MERLSGLATVILAASSAKSDDVLPHPAEIAFRCRWCVRRKIEACGCVDVDGVQRGGHRSRCSGARVHELADAVIDNLAPIGDAASNGMPARVHGAGVKRHGETAGLHVVESFRGRMCKLPVQGSVYEVVQNPGPRPPPTFHRPSLSDSDLRWISGRPSCHNPSQALD